MYLLWPSLNVLLILFLSMHEFNNKENEIIDRKKMQILQINRPEKFSDFTRSQLLLLLLFTFVVGFIRFAVVVNSLES